jgi:hypothetical protein
LYPQYQLQEKKMLFNYDAILQKFYPPESPEYRKYRDDFIELAKNYAIYDAETPQSLHLAGQVLSILESGEEIAFTAGSGVTSISQLSFIEDAPEVADIVKKCLEDGLSIMEII